MAEPLHIPCPKTPTQETTRDQKLKIQTLYYIAGWGLPDLLLHFPQLTRRQVNYALETRPTPQKHLTGRHVKLTPRHRKELVKWVTQTQATRDLSWKELPKCLSWEAWCGEKAIRRAFKLEGYVRGVKRRKPPLSEKNRLARLTWAIEHFDWSDEKWDKILWSDESWTSPGPHRWKQWTTRLKGTSELFLPDCIQQRWQRKIGWMFWGCISGKYGKGAGLFWEKGWKTITKETYCTHTVPVILGYMLQHPGLQFQQDGGPGHVAKYSIDYMARYCGIIPVFWPAFSPDLSPIEALWNRMKDILSGLDPEVHRSYPRLRRAVQEAWDSITDAEVRELVHTMHARCVAVITAHGWYTEF